MWVALGRGSGKLRAAFQNVRAALDSCMYGAVGLAGCAIAPGRRDEERRVASFRAQTEKIERAGPIVKER
jgi:hypothetical protein